MRPEEMIKRYAFADVAGEYLCHHGILGQKWGIRRFQNKDGSLTPAGRKRYLNSDGTLTKDGEKAYAKSGGSSKELNDAKGRSDAKAADEKILKDAGITVETYGSNNQFTSYSIKSKTADGEFEFDGSKGKDESTKDFAQRMKAASDAVSKNNDTVKSYGEKLYDEDAKEWWDEYRGKRPSKEEFVKGLKLDNAMQTSDGKTYLLTYEDTVELYGGHYVTFEVDSDFKYRRHSIEG